MKTRVAVAALVVWMCAGLLPARAAEQPAPEPEYEMTTYQFVLLSKGPHRIPLGERELQNIQEEYLAYMEELYREGQVLISGPVSRGNELRRVVVLNLESEREAAKIVADDPWVEAGKLTPEIHPWFAAKGILRPPSHLLHSEPCWLGLLERPDDAPDYPEEKLQEIQKGHLANIEDMAASGDLVLAGPMADDGILRGILIFRTTDMKRVRDLAARDPAIKAGRLGLKLYSWRVPRGTLPPAGE